MPSIVSIFSIIEVQRVRYDRTEEFDWRRSNGFLLKALHKRSTSFKDLANSINRHILFVNRYLKVGKSVTKIRVLPTPSLRTISRMVFGALDITVGEVVTMLRLVHKTNREIM